MTAKDITDSSRNPDFIPGIFNYCDRWCERCPFTARCGSYALEQKYFPGKEDRDLANQKFWDQMTALFDDTIDLVQQGAEERGIDLDEIEAADDVREWEKSRTWADEGELAAIWKEYCAMSAEWSESSADLLQEKQRELEEADALSLPDRDAFLEAANIDEAFELIQYYEPQIYVKLMRAVSGAMSDERNHISDHPNDCDGSAKVALIGLDRSIGAWGALMVHFPERHEETLDILICLERLRNKAEKDFPHARAFVRPGFDEVV